MPAIRAPFWSLSKTPIWLACLAFSAVLLTLDDPGRTIDEPLDVRPGRTYLETFAKTGLGFFQKETVDQVFRDNAEHPPLGRLLLGIASKLGEPLEILWAGGPDPLGLYVLSARLAPAFCFALLVFRISKEAGRRHGLLASLAAGLALPAMPRLFSHAHLGALDLFITFFWINAYLSAEKAFDSPTPRRSTILAGFAWGLALLTKIHAWLLPPIVLARALSRPNRLRSLSGIALGSLLGLSLFFLGWPWLWFDPIGRFSRFLGTGVERVSIQVLYFGTVYPDRLVPWHYPWFHFLTTVPVGLHLLGFWGLVRAWIGRKSQGDDLRTFAVILYLLAIFSTNVPVYDGERLYLMAFPLWALLIGRGFSDLWLRFGERPLRRKLLALFLACQYWGVVSIHPYGLSYYNLAIGGLPGAERLGLELAYWSESVDRRLLDRLAKVAEPKAPAALAPSLAPNQGRLLTTRALLKKGVVLDDQEGLSITSWLVVYRREAYFNNAIRRVLANGEIVQTQSRQGVWLSALVRIAKSDQSH